MKNVTTTFLAGFCAALVFSLVLPDHAEASPVSKDKAHSKISFMSYTKIFDAEGVFKKWNISGDINAEDFTQSKITVTVQTASVDTNNSKRDNHLREEDFFWVKKHPTATFKTSKITLKKGSTYNVAGVLTIRGVSKKVSIPLTVTKMKSKDGKNRLRIKGKKQLKRQDFGINYKSGLLIPTIRDDVDLMIDVNLTH
jgi:polyisoprenoid-binding protein YceI